MYHHKKMVSAVLALLFLFSLLPLSASAAAETELAVSSTLVSKSEIDLIEVTADLGAVADVSALEWTFGGKPFDAWKTVDLGKYTENSFVKFASPPKVVNGKVVATIEFGLVHYIEGVATRDLSQPRLNRVTLLDNIGEQMLAVTDPATGNKAAVAMQYRPYKNFMLYDEIKPAIDAVLAAKSNGVYTEYKSLGVSYEGRPLHFVILAKDKASVDKYLADLPGILENPAKTQELLKTGKLDGLKVPVFVNNIHPDEYPGVDAQLEALKLLTQNKTLTYDTYLAELPEVLEGSADDPYLVHSETGAAKTAVTFSVDDVLDKVIFLFNFTENPDGRYKNTRQNARGFDVNRDNGTQLQPESKLVAAEVAKWTPASFLDMHGYVPQFLIEPCTPPHDPNYEYDLLMKHGLPHANALGKAAIASTVFDKYLIAQQGMANWDDGAPNYTATYALHHGSLSSTIEFPDATYDSVMATTYMILESGNYIAKNFVDVYTTQLEYFKRGVEGVDVGEAVDKWLVDKDNKQIGRPRGGQKSLFPDYYVIPKAGTMQQNGYEAYLMAEYLVRNGIKVSQLTKDVTVQGSTYPAGSYVVDMKQAKRGLANTVLYKGYDVSGWDKKTTLASGLAYDDIQMYAEIVLNFPLQRGFDCYALFDGAGAFDGALKSAVIAQPVTEGALTTPYVAIANDSTQTIKAVNALLAANMPVLYGKDSFVVTKAGYDLVKGKYSLTVSGVETPSGTPLQQPKVYTPTLTTQSVLKDLGFAVVTDKSSATILADEAGYLKEEDLQLGADYIGMGKPALQTLSKLYPNDLQVGLPSKNLEALYKVNVLSADENMGYGATVSGYVSTGGSITKAPAGATVLATVKPNSFVAGWFPGNSQLDGTVYSFAWQLGDAKLTVFAGDLLRKEYSQVSQRFVANAIYDSASLSFADVTDAQQQDALAKLYACFAVTGYQVDKTADTSNYLPAKAITKAEAASMLVKAFGLPTADGGYADAAGTWYAGAAASLKAKGLAGDSFAGDALLTGADAASLLAAANPGATLPAALSSASGITRGEFAVLVAALMSK